MSSREQPQVPPVSQLNDDVDTFLWHNVTLRTRLAMKRLLGLHGDSDIALAARFGTPPTAEVVDACWTVLRDTWIGSTSAAPARSRIIAALRTVDVGDQPTSSHAGELKYLESLPPKPGHRDVVHNEFLLLGRHRRTMSDEDIARYRIPTATLATASGRCATSAYGVARRCSSYLPGHNPHYIQAVKAHQDPDNPPIPCTIINVANNGTVTVKANGTIHRLWNHEPARLRRTAAHGGATDLNLKWHLLTIDSPQGTINFNMELNVTDHDR